MTTGTLCRFCSGRGCLACGRPRDHTRDREQARKRRDERLERAIHADPPWSALAYAWVWALPVGQAFTPDDLTDAVGFPRSSNAVGPVYAAMLGWGWIAHDGWIPSARLRSNASQVQRWVRV